MTDKKDQNGWTIQSRQLSVLGGGGHNYLALVDPDGVVRQEIHGWETFDDKLGFTFIDRDDFSDAMKKNIGLVEGRPEVEGAEVNVPLNGRSVWEAWAGALASAISHDRQAPYTFYGKYENKVDGTKHHNSNGFWSAVLGDISIDWRDVEPKSWNWTPGTDNPLAVNGEGGFAKEKKMKESANLKAAADTWIDLSVPIVGEHFGLSEEKTDSLHKEVKEKGADWWAAALASEADRLMHDAELQNINEQTGNKPRHGGLELSPASVNPT